MRWLLSYHNPHGNYSFVDNLALIHDETRSIRVAVELVTLVGLSISCAGRRSEATLRSWSSLSCNRLMLMSPGR